VLKSKESNMKRPLIIALAAAGTLLCAGAAHAGNVQWSIGVNLPPVATVISNGPVWAPAPVYYPAPVAYAPPIVYEAPTVVYPAYGTRLPRPIVYGPRIVERPYYGTRYDWRGHPGRDARWVAPVYRGERRYHHGDVADYRR
jgi:hypothetical protein